MKLISIILVIRILCIGNSFSWDAVEQELVPLCAEKGVEVEVHNLYYGGCSLQQHADFLMRDTAAYSHRVCKPNPGLLYSDGHRQSSTLKGRESQIRIVKDTITLRQALRDGRYDYISLQQASHDSGIRSTYEPWLSLLIDTVCAYQPDAQLCWMQTWAYSRDAKHPAYPRYHSDQQEMWDSIQACTKSQIINHKSQMRVIPCGTAIQNARKTRLGDTLCRDGYHLNYQYGRYTAACVWYEILTGRDVRYNRYRNPEMTRTQKRLTQRAAHRAVSSYR